MVLLRGVGGWHLFIAVLAGAVLCGCSGTQSEHGEVEVTTSLAAEPSGGVVEEVSAFLLGIGASEEEASCIAPGVAGDAETQEEVDDRTLPYESFGAAIVALAPGCVSAERAGELDGLYHEFNEAVSAEMQGDTRELWVSQFLAGVATEAEAGCMADALVASENEEWPPLYGSYEPGDPALGLFAECGSPERVVEIYREAYRGPVRDRLVDAGATVEQADCIIDSVGDLDLFLPSDDFAGERSAEMTAELFVDDASGCAPVEQLEAVAAELHEIYDAAS